MSNRDQNFKLISGGLLIDGLGGKPIKNGSVLLEGSKIRSVGPKNQISIPEGVASNVFEYPNKTIMPGLVDCHTHHNGFGDGREGDDLALLPDEILTLQSARNAKASLFSGVTTIRENGPKNMTMFRLRDAVNQGIVVGPRMVLCGRPIAIIGGHMGYFGSEITGPVEAQAMTRQLIKEGADYIKITATGGTTRTSFPLRPSFDLDELNAITGEAHKFGKLTAAHCTSTQGIINSLDAGVDMIIHCMFKDADGTNNFRQDVAERIGKQGAYINPTLHVQRSRLWALQHKKDRLGLTAEEQQRYEAFLKDFDARLEDCRKLINMGLKVITGSDSSWGTYQLGNTVYEVECLMEVGMPPMESILSVTRNAAIALDMDNTVGTLEPGKEADIIVVDGDPLSNIEALWNIEEVFLGGKTIDRGSPKALMAIRQPRPRS